MKDQLYIKKIFGDKHLKEDNATFNKFLVGKKPDTVARYKNYRKLYLKLQKQNYHVRKSDKKGKLLLSTKVPSKSKDIPSYKDLPPTKEGVLYTHYYTFKCSTHYDPNLRHRFAYESRTLKPNDKKAFRLHNDMYPLHVVDYLQYDGTWEIYA